MFTLNEALKIAGLPLKEEASADSILKSAKAAAKSPEQVQDITDEDEKSIKMDIERKLEKGWTASEIRSFLQWLEYFNVEDDEDYCLRKMSEVEARVKERLGNK